MFFVDFDKAVVIDSSKRPPNICTLAGPTRFYRAFDATALALGRLGWLVFSIGTHQYNEALLRPSGRDLSTYWRTHREKIRLSSLLFVIDVDQPDVPNTVPYIGEDTRGEIDFARAEDIPIYYRSEFRNGRLGYPLPEEKGRVHPPCPCWTKSGGMA